MALCHPYTGSFTGTSGKQEQKQPENSRPEKNFHFLIISRFLQNKYSKCHCISGAKHKNQQRYYESPASCCFLRIIYHRREIISTVAGRKYPGKYILLSRTEI
jgi:hypothetical protein